MHRLIITLLFLLTCQTTYAQLIVSDWHTIDDGLITYDTSTGLEWLDLSETTAFTYNYVNNELQGGEFNSWRYASLSEVHTLFNNLGLITAEISIYCCGPIDLYAPYIDMITNVLGYIGSSYPDQHSVFGFDGIVGEQLDSGMFPKFHARITNKDNANISVHIDTDSNRGVSDDFSAWSGHFLTRTLTQDNHSEIPVAPTIHLFFFGLLGLFLLTPQKLQPCSLKR